MFEEDDGPGEAATGFTDEFIDAGIAKLDAVFGAGYAKANPQALAAYIATCASNLNAFMTAATAIPPDIGVEEMLATLEEDIAPRLASKPKRKRS